MATCISKHFFRNVYFLKAIVHCYLNYSIFPTITLKRNTWFTLSVSETKKVQKCFFWLAFSKSIKTKQNEKNIASDVKKRLQEWYTNRWRNYGTFPSNSNPQKQYQYHQIEYPVLADCSLFIKSMHTTLSSVLIRACSQMLLAGCKR